MRWSEEVDLLSEEMRRVLAFLEWQAEWWVTQRERRIGLTPEQAEGVIAYAERQAALRLAMRSRFKSNWRYLEEYAASEDEDVENDVFA